MPPCVTFQWCEDERSATHSRRWCVLFLGGMGHRRAACTMLLGVLRPQSLMVQWLTPVLLGKARLRLVGSRIWLRHVSIKRVEMFFMPSVVLLHRVITSCLFRMKCRAQHLLSFFLRSMCCAAPLEAATVTVMSYAFCHGIVPPLSMSVW